MNNTKIKIHLSYTGVIDIKNVQNNSVIQIKAGSNIEDILSMLGVKKEHKKYIISIVNEKKQRPSYIFQDNDNLSLFLPVGGG